MELLSKPRRGESIGSRAAARLRRRWMAPAAQCGLATLVLVATVGCAPQTFMVPVSIDPRVPQAPVRFRSITSYESAVHVSAAIMVAELGLPVPGQLTLFVYPSRAAYAAGLARDGGMSSQRAAGIAAYSVGLAQHRQLFINDAALRGACRWTWVGVVAHELTHSAQYELSGGRRGHSEQWLREGMADLVATQVLERLGETTLRHERERAMRAVAHVWPARGEARLDLVEIGAPRGWEARHVQSDGSLTYRLAFLLTDELVRDHGWARLAEYFRAFAVSDDRFDHFRTAFGTSVKEFEVAALRRIRAELRAHDWTKLDEPPSLADSGREARPLDTVEMCLGNRG